MITTTEEKWLPEKIYPVNYAGFWDFSPDGTYGDSLINVMDFPTAEQIANEIAKRYNDHSTLTEQNAKLKQALTELTGAIRDETSITGNRIRRSVNLIMKLRAAESLLEEKQK